FCDLLEGRQVAATRERARGCGFVRLADQLERFLARDTTAPDHILNTRCEVAELVLSRIEHLECDEDHLARGENLVGVEHERRLEVIEDGDEARTEPTKAHRRRAAI